MWPEARKLVESGFDSISFFFLSFLRGDLLEDVSVCLAWHFCMLLIPSLVLHRPITLQYCSPLWHVLNHNFLHLLLWKRFLFFFHFSVSSEFVAVLFFWADLIQFRLKTEKRVDTSSFSCGWLLIGDALCTFFEVSLAGVAPEMVLCAFDWHVSFLMWNEAFNQHFCWLMASERQILININLKYQ